MYLTLEKLYEHVDGHFDEHLERIRKYLRQPSISADETGIIETAEICQLSLKVDRTIVSDDKAFDKVPDLKRIPLIG